MNRASFEEGEGELSLLVVGAWGPLLVVWGTQLCLVASSLDPPGSLLSPQEELAAGGLLQ